MLEVIPNIPKKIKYLYVFPEYQIKLEIKSKM